MTIYDLQPITCEATNTVVAPLTEILDNNHCLFEGHKLEMVELDGEILFNAKDVAELLEMSDVTVRRHIQGMSEKQVVKLKNSNVQNLNFRKLHNTGENFLTESGLYKLAFRSNKESAERFTDWVTDEVIPQIRKTGGYIPHNKNMSEAEIMAAAMQIANKTIEEQKRKIELAEKEKENLALAIEDMTPTVEFAEEVLESSNTLTATQIAADYGISAIELNKILKKEGIQYRSGGQWILYSQYKNKGYTDSKSIKAGYSFRKITVWTQKGQKFIYQTLKKLGIYPINGKYEQIEMED